MRKPNHFNRSGFQIHRGHFGLAELAPLPSVFRQRTALESTVVCVVIPALPGGQAAAPAAGSAATAQAGVQDLLAAGALGRHPARMQDAAAQHMPAPSRKCLTGSLSSSHKTGAQQDESKHGTKTHLRLQSFPQIAYSRCECLQAQAKVRYCIHFAQQASHLGSSAFS